MDDGDIAGGEASFAVFEVVVPGADERGVETEWADLIEFGIKGFVPSAEGAGVVESEIFQVMQEEVAGFVDDFVDASDGKQKRSWEDDFLDPIDSFG